MNSINRKVSDYMSANEDNFFQARKNPLVGSGLLERPDLHLGLETGVNLIMTVNGMSVQRWGVA